MSRSAGTLLPVRGCSGSVNDPRCSTAKSPLIIYVLSACSQSPFAIAASTRADSAASVISIIDFLLSSRLNGPSIAHFSGIVKRKAQKVTGFAYIRCYFTIFAPVCRPRIAPLPAKKKKFFLPSFFSFSAQPALRVAARQGGGVLWRLQILYFLYFLL